MNSEATSSPNELHRQLRELTERTLSPAARYAHVMLLLIATAVGIVVAALLLTEPALPLRTRAAFGVMCLIAASWVAYACWVLLRRRPLLQAHRVVAGYLSTVFSGLFACAAIGAGIATGAPAAWFAGSLGAVMFAVAVMLLVRARWNRSELRARRDELVRALAGD